MRAKNRFFKVIRDAEVPEIYLYDVIGDDMFGGVSDRQFAEELAQLKGAKQIDIRVNSPGGDVFQGHAIFNLLRNHPARIRMFVDGIAASIASEIILAGDEIEIAENARIMIHQARGGMFGTAGELQDFSKLVASINDDLVATYAARGGSSADEFRRMMQKDTYFTAKQAVDMKLADRVGGRLAVAACLTPELAAKLHFQDVPPELLEAQEEEVEDVSVNERLRQEINQLKIRK